MTDTNEMLASEKLAAVKRHLERKMLECMKAEKVHDFLAYQGVHEFIEDLG